MKNDQRIEDYLRKEEYRALQQENRENRSHIFERPFLILGIVGAVLSISIEFGYVQFIYPFLIFILAYNLWFIADRLRSDARLISYIQLFHEAELKTKWIGWETALRKYRIWRSTHNVKSGEIKDELLKKINPGATHRRLWFFWGIWIFHILLSTMILMIGILECFKVRADYVVSYNFLLLVISYIAFLYPCVSFSPTSQKKMLEFERAIWLSVFKK